MSYIDKKVLKLTKTYILRETSIFNFVMEVSKTIHLSLILIPKSYLINISIERFRSAKLDQHKMGYNRGMMSTYTG